MFKRLKEQCFEFSVSKGQGSLCFAFWVFMNYICSQGGVQGGQVVALLCFAFLAYMFFLGSQGRAQFH